eukprot:1192926-Prorocentrum_minimum.AAC.1
MRAAENATAIVATRARQRVGKTTCDTLTHSDARTFAPRSRSGNVSRALGFRTTAPGPTAPLASPAAPRRTTFGHIESKQQAEADTGRRALRTEGALLRSLSLHSRNVASMRSGRVLHARVYSRDGTIGRRKRG